MSAPDPHDAQKGRALRILLLAPQPFFQDRGTPIAVRLLSDELVRAGNSVDLLVFHEGEAIDIQGVSILRTPALPGLHGIKPGFSLKKLFCDALMFGKCLLLVRRGKYHVIHAVEEAVFIAFILRYLFGTRFVYDMDSLLSMQMADTFPMLGRVSMAMEWCEKQVMRKSIGVITVCEALEEKARQFAPHVPVLRLEDISLLEDINLVEASAGFDEDIRQTENLTGCIFMYVGNLEKYQGMDLMLEAFALLGAAERQMASLVIIGGKETDRVLYRNRADCLGIGDRVFFLGPRPVKHLAHYLTQADVLVSPRIQGNNTPMKIYSYLDSGRPVLATRLPTHTQVLDDEISCLAQPEPQAFMNAMTLLLQDPSLRLRLAVSAKNRVCQEYSREAFRGKIQQFYGEIATLIFNKSRQ